MIDDGWSEARTCREQTDDDRSDEGYSREGLAEEEEKDNSFPVDRSRRLAAKLSKISEEESDRSSPTGQSPSEARADLDELAILALSALELGTWTLGKKVLDARLVKVIIAKVGTRRSVNQSHSRAEKEKTVLECSSQGMDIEDIESDRDDDDEEKEGGGGGGQGKPVTNRDSDSRGGMREGRGRGWTSSLSVNLANSGSPQNHHHLAMQQYALNLVID